MYHLEAKPGWHSIDNKMIRTDSLMEATIIEKLVDHGFSQKWRRPTRGISFASARYTPDVELSIDRDGSSIRAIVEFKPLNASEFSVEARQRMLTATRYYSRSLPLLYVHRTKQWYEVLPSAELVAIAPPAPGLLNISQLPRPRLFIPVSGSYGHTYASLPTPYLLNKIADGLESGVRFMVGSKKTYQSRRKRR